MHKKNKFDKDFTIMKIVMIGDHSVGKKAIVERYYENTFGPPRYICSIGIDFRLKSLYFDISEQKFDDSSKNSYHHIKLQIFGTLGRERFGVSFSSYFRGAKGVLLVYDITNRENFDNLSKWIEQIYQH